MNIAEHMEGPNLVLSISGRLDSSTSKNLEDVLPDRMQSTPTVVVDLSEVEYVSSAGLRVLLKAAKIARASSHKLALIGLAPQVQDVFDVSGFSTIFLIRADLSTALEALT
jgi:anti-sigma B factor antagonist